MQPLCTADLSHFYRETCALDHVRSTDQQVLVSVNGHCDGGAGPRRETVVPQVPLEGDRHTLQHWEQLQWNAKQTYNECKWKQIGFECLRSVRALFVIRTDTTDSFWKDRIKQNLHLSINWSAKTAMLWTTNIHILCTFFPDALHELKVRSMIAKIMRILKNGV